jgi:hypothetical protein
VTEHIEHIIAYQESIQVPHGVDRDKTRKVRLGLKPGITNLDAA